MNQNAKPVNQSIILQNTNENEPIQLKVNNLTDYWALSFTIVASIIVSTITAFVTITLVTNSNKKLIDSQNKQNSDLIKSQNEQLQKEIKSKNRQEWINKVRALISEAITDSNSFILSVEKEHRLRVIKYNNATQQASSLNYIELDAPYPETVDLMRSFDNITLQLDLLLSKSDDLDRNIHSKMIKISKIQTKILQEYFSCNYSNPNSSQRQKINLISYDIHKLSNEIIDLTKELLKNEWNRVKNLE